MSVVVPTITNKLRSRYVREPLIILFAYFPYYLARHTVEDARHAFDNAYSLMRLEQSLGIFAELSLQSATISYSLLVHLFNIIYFYGHWPVILVFGVYLFIKNPRVYVITRNAFLLSGIVALIFFALYPVAPPRMSTPGIVDTLAFTVPISYDSSPLVNPFAAMPSMHVGWNLLIAAGIYHGARSPLLRYPVLALPPAMMLATVVTGNHFYLDGIAGGVLALTAFFVARWLYQVWPRVEQGLKVRVRRLFYPEGANQS